MALAGLRSLGYLAGLLHDMGKFKREFKDYLEAIARGEKRERGSVNHTFCAPRFVLEAYHEAPISEESFYRALASEMVAFATGSHHGMFDCIDPEGRSGFDRRMTRDGIAYRESVDNFLRQCANREELDGLMDQAVDELKVVVSRLGELASSRKESVKENDAASDQEEHRIRAEGRSYYGSLARLLLSALIDADRHDAAEFDGGTEQPRFSERIESIWAECVSFAEARHAELRARVADTPINQVRESVYRQCASFAEKPTGVYRLNVPTGGGKTLSVLAYALRHAKQHGKRRIVFAFPLLTILDQNAREIRRNVPDGKGYVLEHHLNVVQEHPVADELDRHELLAETWDAPIVITTLVQFLNTLFSGKGSCIRRFQALCDSIIVIDEVQTVPLKMLSLFNLAINFLSKICGATVVLCSATQPCFEAVRYPIAGEMRSMVELKDGQKEAFKRTKLLDGGRKDLEGIASLGREMLGDAQSLLIVCNKKDQAKILFKRLGGEAEHVFHLSAGMCHAHREETVARLEAALEASRAGGGKVLCVATQVIEAGVDLSFVAAIRFAAGLDSAIQTAGRVDRNGEWQFLCPVRIVSCKGESLSHLKGIAHAKSSLTCVLCDYAEHPEKYGNDLASDAAVGAYFKQLYTGNGVSLNSLDYPVSLSGCNTTLLSLLSVNEDFLSRESHGGDRAKYLLVQAFKTAGKRFKVFDDDTVDVIVPYGKEGKEVIAGFESEGIEADFEKQRKLLSEARRFSVALQQYQAEALKDKGAIAPKCNGLVLALHSDYYDRDCGVVDEPLR